jgi:hypothetical protein
MCGLLCLLRTRGGRLPLRRAVMPARDPQGLPRQLGNGERQACVRTVTGHPAKGCMG